MTTETIASIIEFFSMLSGGFLIALLFDLFRSMRKAVKYNNGKFPAFAVHIQDILFLLVSFVIAVLLIYRVSNGRLSWYISLGCLCGAALYFFVVEKVTGTVLFVLFYTVIKIVKNAVLLSCKVYRKMKYRTRAKNIAEKSKKNIKKSKKMLKKASGI